MRISDWSSDVCSSDLEGEADAGREQAKGEDRDRRQHAEQRQLLQVQRDRDDDPLDLKRHRAEGDEAQHRSRLAPAAGGVEGLALLPPRAPEEAADRKQGWWGKRMVLGVNTEE